MLIVPVKLVDPIPSPPAAQRTGGHPTVYSDWLFFKALVIMIVKDLQTMHELLTVLEQPTLEMQELCTLRTQEGALSGMPLLGRRSGCPTGSVARANWRAGRPLGRAHEALGSLWPRRGRGQPGIAR